MEVSLRKARGLEPSSFRWATGLALFLAAISALLLLADASGSTPLRWAAGLASLAVTSVLLVFAASKPTSPPWAAGLATSFLAAISLLLLFAAVSDPFWRFRGDWVWHSPTKAVLGGAAALAASCASLLVAAKAWRRRIRPTVAVALALILVIIVAVGGLALVRSGSTMLMPEVELRI